VGKGILLSNLTTGEGCSESGRPERTVGGKLARVKRERRIIEKEADLLYDTGVCRLVSLRRKGQGPGYVHRGEDVSCWKYGLMANFADERKLGENTVGRKRNDLRGGTAS